MTLKVGCGSVAVRFNEAHPLPDARFHAIANALFRFVINPRRL